MPRSPRFRPPKISDPPDLVFLTWIDAYGDNESDGPAAQAGRLIELPRVGYYVRHSRGGPYGSFIVLAAEWDHEKDGSVHVRDTISIPVGWITSWAMIDLTKKQQIWPPMAVNEGVKE